MTDNQHIKWGVVGTTGFAGNFFAPAVRNAENADLHAVCGSDIHRAREFADKMGAQRAYGSVEELAADQIVEAVWVASPNHMHHEHAKTLLEAGMHVLCEKPVDISPGGARLLFSVAAVAGKKLTVGYNMRQDPVLKKLRARVMNGEFGKPSLMRINRFHAYPDDPSEWRKSKETSGGWSINDIGTHCIDQCIWFLGSAENVSGHLTTVRFDVDTDDLAVVGMDFESGAVGSIEVSTALQAGAPRVEFYGTKGWFAAELTRMASVKRRWEQIGDEPAREIPVEKDADLFKLEAEAFSRAVAGHEDVAVGADDAVHNIEIIEQARGYRL